MATEKKILAQNAPVAATNTTLYTAPALTTTEALLIVTNRSDKAARYNIALTQSGNTLASKDYIAFDRIIEGRGMLQIEGLILAAGDFVTIKATNANLSFTLLGSETTA